MFRTLAAAFLSIVFLGTGLPVVAGPGDGRSTVASDHLRPRHRGLRHRVVVRRHVPGYGPRVVVVRRPVTVAPYWVVRSPVVVQWERTVYNDAGDELDAGDASELEPGEVLIPEGEDAGEALEREEASDEGDAWDGAEGADQGDTPDSPTDGSEDDGYVFDNEQDAFENLERMEAEDPERMEAEGPERMEAEGPDGGSAVYLAEMERQILELVNAERVAAGLGALTNAPLLTVAARRHSREMAELGYFSHDSPTEENRTLAMRLANAGLSSYGMAGENIALSTSASAEQFVRMWMDSPGHRENLLRPEFKFSGIGVYTDGSKTWATQNFTSTN
jgi:uncharacterized protein YkwD